MNKNNIEKKITHDEPPAYEPSYVNAQPSAPSIENSTEQHKVYGSPGYSTQLLNSYQMAQATYHHPQYTKPPGHNTQTSLTGALPPYPTQTTPSSMSRYPNYPQFQHGIQPSHDLSFETVSQTGHASSGMGNSSPSTLNQCKQEFLKHMDKIERIKHAMLAQNTTMIAFQGPGFSQVSPSANIVDVTPIETAIIDLECSLKTAQDTLKKERPDNRNLISKYLNRKKKLEHNTCCFCCLACCLSPPEITYRDLCDNKPKLEFSGCCGGDTVHANICSDMKNHDEWITATPKIQIEGVGCSPDVHLNGFSNSLIIDVQGTGCKPRIHLKGLCLSPVIKVEGTGVKVQINVDGILHKPDIDVQGLSNTVKIIVNGVYNKPSIKNSGSNCTIKCRINGIYSSQR